MSSGVLDSVKLDLVDSADKVSEFTTWLGSRRPTDALGVDTETASLNAYGGKPLRLVQFGDTQTGWAIPWHLWGGLALDTLRRWDGDIVLHNARFDMNWIRKESIRAGSPWRPNWSKVHDTLTQAHLDDPTRSRALKTVSGLLVDSRAASSQVVLDKEMNLNNWDWDSVPIVREGAGSSYWIYGALDPVLTAHLHEIFTPIRETYRTAYDLEMGIVHAIADMEWLGAAVDLPYCDQMMVRIADYVKRIREWGRDAYGVGNMGSMQECIAKFEEYGHEIVVFTDSGKKSLSKESLQALAIQCDENGQELGAAELARQILKMRHYEKQAGPYFSNFQKFADSDSLVHPTIWPCGTRTARMSITDPALQTMPRGDAAVRDAFIPRTPDNVLVSIDADQIEMRLAAHFSRDEGLRTAFMESADFFNTVASQAWQDTIVKGDPRRQTMKNGCYGKLYGASVFKIATTAGVPVGQMERVMAQFDHSYPGIRKLQESAIQKGKQRAQDDGRPWIKTPTGRRMFGDKGKEYALTNYLIQSHAAELLKQGILDLHAAGLGDYLILPVHDELLLDVPRDQVDEIKHTLETTLNNVAAHYFVPVTWSADVMQERWGDKYR